MPTSTYLFQGLGVRLLRVGLLAVMAFCLTATTSTRAQTLTDFGYKRMTVPGTPASGARPLAVVLMSYAGSPGFLHDKAYYDDLIFNPFKTSFNGYFLENSQGRFHWSKAGAGIYGPFSYAATDYGVDADDGFTRLYLALQALAGAGFDFTQYDANGDSEVTTNELSVLVIDNKLTTGGVNRATKPNTFDYTNPSGVHVAVKLAVATFGQRTSFSAMTHEISHQLGTIEMYGSNGAGANAGYTLMGPRSASEN
jgi:M6 family metalloprotease-like protein